MEKPTTTEEVSSFEPELNPHQAYDLLNKVYLKSIKEAETKIEDHFAHFLKNKKIIIDDCKDYLRERYKETIENVEKSLKTVEDNLQTVDKNNQLEVKRLKRKLEDAMALIENEKDIDNQFAEIFNKLERKFKNLTLKEMIKEDMKFSLRGKFGRLGWSEKDDPILEVPSGGTSYKCYASTEVFEFELTCKVKILSITPNLINGYWNYAFGLIKSGTENNNQSSYYNNCVLMQANGHCNVKYSGSSDTVNKPFDDWKVDDILGVYRDTEGKVYFSINDGERKKCFDDIFGNMKICLGFASSINGNRFEMVECGPFFN